MKFFYENEEQVVKIKQKFSAINRGSKKLSDF